MRNYIHPPQNAHDLSLPKNSLPGSSLDNRSRQGPFLIALGGNFSHVRPVLLLDVRIVVFFVRTVPCELNPSLSLEGYEGTHRANCKSSRGQSRASFRSVH